MRAEEDSLLRIELVLGRVLVTGVVVSACFLAAGIAAYLANGRASGMLLRAGLVTLMATPILRVAVSVAEYARLRDWFFTFIALAVLGVLLTSVTIALARAW
jgi:uncharacterized membrane protein